jgi:hypothetical protein
MTLAGKRAGMAPDGFSAMLAILHRRAQYPTE